MKVQRQRIIRRPTKKAAVPFSFCLRAKKRSVLEGPIIIVRPRRKRIWEVLEVNESGERGRGKSAGRGMYIAHC